MTDKKYIRDISLGLLGVVSVCTLTLLTDAQQAQAAPTPGPGDDPIVVITEQSLPDRAWIAFTPGDASVPVLSGSVMILRPDPGAVATGVPGLVGPRPKGSWWYDLSKPGILIHLPEGPDSGPVARAR